MLIMLFESDNVVFRGYVTPIRVVSSCVAPLYISVHQTSKLEVPRTIFIVYLHRLVGNSPPCTEYGYLDYVINIPTTLVYYLTTIPIPVVVSVNDFDIDLCSVEKIC